ncbi:hypothetical protein C8J57DRAFT_1495018 [Mycena rebaudengoi]|nr:hypothetical protein C8J57DRAFT_1495018 [Mycena rebaudengoi]
MQSPNALRQPHPKAAQERRLSRVQPCLRPHPQPATNGREQLEIGVANDLHCPHPPSALGRSVAAAAGKTPPSARRMRLDSLSTPAPPLGVRPTPTLALPTALGISCADPNRSAHGAVYVGHVARRPAPAPLPSVLGRINSALKPPVSPHRNPAPPSRACANATRRARPRARRAHLEARGGGSGGGGDRGRTGRELGVEMVEEEALEAKACGTPPADGDGDGVSSDLRYNMEKGTDVLKIVEPEVRPESERSLSRPESQHDT